MRRNGRLTACISASSKLLVAGARLETRHLCQIPPVDFIKPLRETSLHRRHCLRTSPRTLSAGNDPDRVPGLFWTAIKGWYVWQSFGRTPSPFQTISKFIYIYIYVSHTNDIELFHAQEVGFHRDSINCTGNGGSRGAVFSFPWATQRSNKSPE